jgi:dihydroorotate dehydrogenase
MGRGAATRSSWYRSVARPLFFALPPETAHRLAHLLLGLPLPWERLGHPTRDPSLEVTLAGIPLANPLGLAAGFDKTGARVGALGRLGFGYVVAGTFTRRPRRGNPKPRIVRHPGREAMVNAMGLPNPGAEAAAAALAREPRTGPRLASIADEDLHDVLQTHALLEPHVDAIELNASCPNVSWGRDRDNEAHLATLLRELGARRSRPLFVKLPPFRSQVERDVVLALADVATQGGADALTCSNSLPVRAAGLAVGAGGSSGRGLLRGTIENVRAVREATGGAVPINACGGVSTPADALACLEAGAASVQLYSSLVFRGPGIVGDLTAGLAAISKERRSSLAAMIGAGASPGAGGLPAG